MEDIVDQFNVFTINLSLVLNIDGKEASNQNIQKTAQATPSVHLAIDVLPNVDPLEVDVCFFENAYKVYCRDQTKSFRTFQQDDQLWASWTFVITIKMAISDVEEFFNHYMTITYIPGIIGDRAKIDHPKGFHGPFIEKNAFERSWDSEILENEIISSRTSISPNNRRETVPYLKSEEVSPWLELFEEFIPVAKSQMFYKDSYVITESELKNFSLKEVGLEVISEDKIKLLNEWIVYKSHRIEENEHYQFSSESKVSAEDLEAEIVGSEQKAKKSEKFPSKIESSKSKPLITIPMEIFFGNTSCQILKTKTCLSDTILKCIIAIAEVDDNILAPSQRNQLNPMTIKILATENLPNQQDDKNVKQVFLRYVFFNDQIKESVSHPRSQNIVWNETKVFFLGKLDYVFLQEAFMSELLQVEIHNQEQKQSNYGFLNENVDYFKFMNSNDQELARKILRHESKFHILENKFCSTCGVAKISLFDLLRGETSLLLYVPVSMKVIKNFDGRKQISKKVNTITYEDDIYVKSGTMMEVFIHLAKPFAKICDPNFQISVANLKDYYLRSVFILKDNELLPSVFDAITTLNTEALKGKTINNFHTLGVISSSLPKMNELYLIKDLISGVYIFDGEVHIFILESSDMDFVNKLFQTATSLCAADITKIKVCHNSSVLFSRKLYFDLPSNLKHIEMKISLNEIFKFSKIYTKQFSPYNNFCTKGLHKLNQILKCTTLEDIAKHNLFPLPEELKEINKNVGVINFSDKFESAIIGDHSLASSKRHNVEPKLLKMPLHSLSKMIYNDGRLEEVIEMFFPDEKKIENFIRKNKELAGKSKVISKVKGKYCPPLVRCSGSEIHNYSSQTYNSATIAQALLHDKLAKQFPGQMFQYNQLLSLKSTVVPSLCNKRVKCIKDYNLEYKDARCISEENQCKWSFLKSVGIL